MHRQEHRGKTSCNFSTSPMRMDAVQSVGMNSRSRNPGNGAGHNSVGLNVRSSNLTTSSLSGFSESFLEYVKPSRSTNDTVISSRLLTLPVFTISS